MSGFCEDFLRNLEFPLVIIVRWGSMSWLSLCSKSQLQRTRNQQVSVEITLRQKKRTDKHEKEGDTYLVDFNVSSVNWHKLLFSMKVTITLCYRLKTSIKPWGSRRTATQRGWERRRKGSKDGMRQAKLMWERKGRIRREERESAAKC